MSRRFEIKAKFKVVTPLHMGGADPDKVELRLPSIKGMLRFWWRALNYEKFPNMADLREKEAYIFGSSDEKVGQSKVLMRLLPMNKSPKPIKMENGTRYLGYGFLKDEKENKWFEPFEFTLYLATKNEDILKKEVIPAIKILGLLGGLGKRARKGFGSLTLLKLSSNQADNWDFPDTMEKYKKCLHKLLPKSNKKEEPEISAFSRHENCRIDLLWEGNKAQDLLNPYGREMLRYRIREGRFEDDHKWSKGLYRGKKDFHPRRAIFGLPHKYQSDAEVKPCKHERRASPLFYHIHRISKNSYAGVTILLPSLFLPETQINGKNEIFIEANGKDVPLDCDYSVLTDFIDNIKPPNSQNNWEKYFPNREKLWP